MHSTSSTTTRTEPRTYRKSGRHAMRRTETLAGFLFVSPMLIGVAIFMLIPIIATFVLGFAEWNFFIGFHGFEWAGTSNFSRLLHDEVFIQSLVNNLIFLLVVPVYMIISLILAVLIDRYVFMKNYFKVAYFMPYLATTVAVAVVWRVLFQPSYGPVNSFLKSIGIAHPPGWLADPDFALISMMMVSVWISIGFNMVVYIAGLQSIPRDLYESADIDGASAWKKFSRITLPMLSPTSFFLMVSGLIY